jgi:hypothetical protein
LILSYLFCCGLLQGEVCIILELPDQKAQNFLVPITLKHYLLFRSYVECTTRPRSAPPVAPVSSPRLSRAHKPLALGPCHPSCLDSFFLPCLIWCMLLIHVCLAPRIHTSSEQRAPSTDFPRCFLLSPTELSLAICF